MLKDNLVKLEDLPAPIEAPAIEVYPNSQDFQPHRVSQMRCPLPSTGATSDALRQFYVGNLLPTRRLMSPSTSTSSASSSSGTNTVNISTGTSSKIEIQQTALTTPSLAPFQSFYGTINLGKVFQLLQISSDSAVRVEVYSTNNALVLDKFRELDVPPSYGTEQGLILDVALDLAPYSFELEVNGNNLDVPVQSISYIAVTNIGQGVNTSTVTFSYVPIVS